MDLKPLNSPLPAVIATKHPAWNILMYKRKPQM